MAWIGLQKQILLSTRPVQFTSPHMDYTQFLQKPDEALRLPCFGGRSVCDDRQTYRLREDLPPGWYRFKKSGRYVVAEDLIEPELGVWKLPQLKGYVFNRRLISNDSQGQLYGLPENEDLQKFTPVAAR